MVVSSGDVMNWNYWFPCYIIDCWKQHEKRNNIHKKTHAAAFECQIICNHHLSRRMTKPTKWHVRLAKTRISLGIRSWIFTVHMKKHWALNYLLSTQQRLIRLGGCSGWSVKSLHWTQSHFVGFVMRQLIYITLENILPYIIIYFFMKIVHTNHHKNQFSRLGSTLDLCRVTQ